jgi:hypothetical protein
VGSLQAKESPDDTDAAHEADDFDGTSDLCDFGFVLAGQPIRPVPEKRTDKAG